MGLSAAVAAIFDAIAEIIETIASVPAEIMNSIME